MNEFTSIQKYFVDIDNFDVSNLSLSGMSILYLDFLLEVFTIF